MNYELTAASANGQLDPRCSTTYMYIPLPPHKPLLRILHTRWAISHFSWYEPLYDQFLAVIMWSVLTVLK